MDRESDNSACSFAIPSTLLGLRDGFARLNEWLARANIKQETKDRANLVYEEIATNIIRYGFEKGDEHLIDIALRIDSETLTLDFLDDGHPFDPRTVKMRRAPETLESAKIGGRGLLLVSSAAKSLDYERTAGGRNHLVVTLSRKGKIK